MAFPFLALLPVVGKLLDKVIPDPQAAAKAKFDMMKLAQDGDLAHLDADVKLAIGQMEINKEEAKAGVFRGGWRPFIGWTCGFALTMNFVVLPLLGFAATLWAFPVPPPFDLSVMMPVVFGMLGLGGMRTYEKASGLK